MSLRIFAHANLLHDFTTPSFFVKASLRRASPGLDEKLLRLRNQKVVGAREKISKKKVKKLLTRTF